MKEKIISMFLVAGIIITSLPSYVFAKDFSFEDDFSYGPVSEVKGGGMMVGNYWQTSNINTAAGNMTGVVENIDPSHPEDYVLRQKGYGQNKYNTINLSIDRSQLKRQHRIEFDTKRGTVDSYAYDVSFGCRFMINNGEADYYEIGFNRDVSGQPSECYRPYFQKVINNNIVDGSYRCDRTASGKKEEPNLTVWIHFTIDINENGITWNVKTRDGKGLDWTDSYEDPNVFDISGNQISFGFMQRGDKRAYFDNFKISSYKSYIDLPEPSNVMYVDCAYNKALDANNVLDLGNAYPMRRLMTNGISPTVYASNDKSDWQNVVYNTSWDKEWLNRDFSDEYRYVKLDFEEDIDNVSVLSDFYDTDTYTMFLGDTTKMYPRIGNTLIKDNIKWSSSDDNIATVEDGIVNGIFNGTVKITASTPNGEISTNVRVVGEREIATENGKLDEYVAEKATTVDKIHNAVENNDLDSMISILDGTDAYGLKFIRDFDLKGLTVLGEEQINKLAKRLLTYRELGKYEGNMTIETLDEVLNIINNESLLSKLQSGINAQETFENNADVFGCDITNKYYTENKSDVLSDLEKADFNNISEVNDKFIDSCLLSSLKNMISYSLVQEYLEQNADTIGYDKEHYNKISDKTSLYKDILKNKKSFTTLENLKKFVDEFVSTSKPGTSSGSGSGSGSGSSSQKPSNVGSVSSAPVVGDATFAPNTDIETVKSIYKDIDPSHWAYEGVKYLSAKKVINGYEDGNFCPDKNITRGEFVKILSTAFELATPEEKSEFNDLSEENWQYEYMLKAKNAGVIKGDENGNCNADKNITREELTVMLYRIYKNLGISFDESDETTVFSDSNTISEWAYMPVMQLRKVGIVKGSDNLFKPHDNATRAEAAKMVYSLIMQIDAQQKAEEAPTND